MHGARLPVCVDLTLASLQTPVPAPYHPKAWCCGSRWLPCSVNIYSQIATSRIWSELR